MEEDFNEFDVAAFQEEEDVIIDYDAHMKRRKKRVVICCACICVCGVLIVFSLAIFFGIFFGVSANSESSLSSEQESSELSEMSSLSSDESHGTGGLPEVPINILYHPANGPVIYSTFYMNNQRTNMISSTNNAPANTTWASNADPNRAVPSRQGLLIGSLLINHTLAAFDMKDGSMVSNLTPEEVDIYDFRDILMVPKSETEDYGIIISSRCDFGLFTVRESGISWLKTISIPGISLCRDTFLSTDFRYLYIQMDDFDSLCKYDIMNNYVEWISVGVWEPIVLRDLVIGVASIDGNSKYDFLALDAHTGDILWRIHNFPILVPLTSSKSSIPISEQFVYIATTGIGCSDDCPLFLYCFETRSGIQLWSAELDPFMWPTHGAMPVIFIIESPNEYPTLDHLVITGNYDFVYAYTPTGDRLWSTQTGNLILAITNNNQILLSNGSLLSQSGTFVSNETFEKHEMGVLDDNMNFFYFSYMAPFGCA